MDGIDDHGPTSRQSSSERATVRVYTNNNTRNSYREWTRGFPTCPDSSPQSWHGTIGRCIRTSHDAEVRGDSAPRQRAAGRVRRGGAGSRRCGRWRHWFGNAAPAAAATVDAIATHLPSAVSTNWPSSSKLITPKPWARHRRHFRRTGIGRARHLRRRLALAPRALQPSQRGEHPQRARNDASG